MKSAIKSVDVVSALKKLPPAELSQLNYDLGNVFHWWIGEPTRERILEIRRSVKELDGLIDFEVVLDRLKKLDLFNREDFGIRLGTFFPELSKIGEVATNLIHQLPNGVRKAEHWLYPIAKDAGADADLEATIYFASRGRGDLVDVDGLRKSWYRSVCYRIETGRPVAKIPADVLARAKAGTISLHEAASLLTFNGHLFRFASFRDEEEDFIDATICRSVEWLGITGFDPWIKSSISDLSVGPQSGVDHVWGGWWLFYFCRSDLALRIADRAGLEAWLWGLLNGAIERDKPWRMFSDRAAAGRLHQDYLPLAGMIPFIWTRIEPRNIHDDVVIAAVELLLQTQMQSGGWPLCSDDTEPCLLSTLCAVHGLASRRSTGWQQPAERAARWLLEQQQSGGYWHIGGGPTVMLTVLALDSLSLAAGDTRVTFKLNTNIDPATVSVRMEQQIPDQTYNYPNESWFEPVFPKTKSISISAAHTKVCPPVAIIVATEIELRQVLRVMTAPSDAEAIWKVMHNQDVYYLGTFGAFPAVVSLSGMGSQGVGGSALSVYSLIEEWDPDAVILVGIAFGANRAKQSAADVLVAEQIIPYERQRIGDAPVFRNPIPVSSLALLNRFRNALDWCFKRPDASKCRIHFGPLLSGEKVVDSTAFKEELLRNFPAAIGGEMEGTGVWSAGDRKKKEWIVVKGVCDWADGAKHDGYQPMAAAAAVSLCKHVFSDAHVLDGVLRE